jgi:NADH-quinone oxidoreductase subunit L
VAGIATAWLLYLRRPDLPARVANFFGPVYSLVERKYGFDELYSWLLAGGARNLGRGFWRGGDQAVIDGIMVNGSARVVGWFSGVVRLIQTGLLNTYAFLILFGILSGLSWVMWRYVR